ncbi:MAG: CehA/McbA family metallohydrolase [Rhodanobacteraceae bacterium]|nr:CehA/McbA family metallohydrolase [Rhodanobacteraceae bacterium]MBP9155324.1 CehA/McbA family metallohydrolase [Xanthomonadales bacterium]HQW80456.1 Ig-like domain-containing protein [Pseudomonadota bacterium]
MLRSTRLRATTLALCLAAAFSVQSARPVSPDHHEFEAAIYAPYAADKSVAREFTLYFSYIDARDPSTVAWKVELLTQDGSRVLRHWHGEERLFQKQIETVLPWDGAGADKRLLADGFYKVCLTATAGDPTTQRSRSGSLAKRVDQALLDDGSDAHVQEWEVRVGAMPKIAMPDFNALPTTTSAKSQAATASLPYTVYFGNLHGQSNDSDGGGAIGSCTSSQPAQTGAFGPADAFNYARGRGLDFLMESEHNHYFDGSSSTNTSASPATAINRYAAGRTAMANSNSANPNFLALYGMEWGVISNGGHLNVINGNKLAAWEYNSSNQLLGDVFVAKNDYANLYTTMKARGWVGQFNHPSTSDQFKIGTTVMGYHVDGDEVMVAAEIMNTSAFSSNTTETETSRSTYSGAFDRLLENGFHVAPTTNQDNHCANWGASYTNRTGVLLATGSTLNEANFVAAMKARRIYATMDKNSQLITTANGNIMGSRISNNGALNLVANFANSAGRSVSQVQWYRGVPKRGGTVTLLASTATYSFTPATGEHFFYAKLTQDDGKILWSAPIWVTQGSGGGDTTAPTVSASVTGTSGTITLNATASDNVGVSSVEFFIDGASRGSDTTAPYSLAFNSTALSNGSHSLTARASDAAGNSTTSTAASFTVNNTTSDTTAPTVTATETGSSGTITLAATASDNVGVSKVEFYVDSVLKGTDTTSPYSMTLNSTTLSNASHALTAKAFDAAGNTKTSTAVNFTINNTATIEQIKNGGFESGSTNWTATSGVITNDASFAAYAGSWKAWLNGYGATHTDSAYQTITIPSAATQATLTFWLDVATDETTTTSAYDTLKAQVRNSSNTVLATLATYSNLNAAGGYSQKSFNLLAYKGQTIRIYFLGVEGSQVATSFVVDNVSVITK